MTKKSEKKRNYQIDVLKAILTVFVFIAHTQNFIGDQNTQYVKVIGRWGWWAVHFFFVISGMLMVSSYFKAEPKDAAGGAVVFLIKKIKGLALPYVSAFAICFVIVNVVNILSGIWKVDDLLIYIPNFLGVTASGINVKITVNAAMWYISAMVFVSFPLYYLLARNAKFFLYVFAPVCALASFGYLYHFEVNWKSWLAVSTDGALRAFCGLLFGCVAWLVFFRFLNREFTRRQRILLTGIEILLYSIIFYTYIFKPTHREMIYAAMLLVPISIAISFSGKSYINHFFQNEKFKYLSTLNLAVYLTHIGALRITRFLFPECSYKFGVTVMMGFTVVLCIIYFLLIKLMKFAIPKFKRYLAEET